MKEAETECEIELHIEGMHCYSCTKGVQGALERVPDVESADVNFATARATIHLNNPVDAKKLIKAVEDSGYQARVVSHDASSHLMHGDGERQAFFRLIAVAILCSPFFVYMGAMLLGYHFPFPAWLQWILATPIQFGGGWTFYRASYYAAKQGAASMDVLIAMGTTAAYVLSVFVWLGGWPAELYFESSAMIITLVLLGRWLEAKSKSKASEAIGKLLEVQPKAASVERDGRFQSVPVGQVVVDDILQVQAGERIAVDAIVVDGESEVNEATITGESVPRVKKAGDKVLAGTINQNGSLRIRATEVGSKTILAGVIRLVEKAQQSKAPVQRLADAVSAVFVPVVLVIGIATLLGWWMAGFGVTQALISAVSVLIIACPCALGLATPIVVVAASGRGAESGILFKEASSIETAHKISTLCFDKTGTLTEGKPSLTDIIPAPGHTENDVLQVALAMESQVQHPLAAAIANEGLERDLPILKTSDFQSSPGKGVTAVIDEEFCGVGSPRFARENGIAINEERASQLEQQAKTVMVVWKGETAIGYLAVKDRLRDHCKEALGRLKKMGISLLMLTGDQEKTARTIAKEAGIEQVHAGLLPQQKLDLIERLKQEGKSVGMVGDGVNDAPALTAADVGIALGAASDVAMETASIALMRDDLLAVPEAISLTRLAFRKIKQNLFFAFIYNIIGIPLAAFGMLNPIVAAAAMAMSSLSVVLNALLLKWWKG